MPVEWTVLASGSAGNASLLEADGFGLLVDAGLGPRQLAGRLSAVGRCWRQIDAVVLTHTHGDHWNRRTLGHLVRLGIPLYCHRDHARWLRRTSSAFAALEALKLVRFFAEGQQLVCGGVRCLPLALTHDCTATFGFRFEGGGDLFSRPWALGYASDLGCWDSRLADAFSDVDLLALEFNHDVQLQHNSGRSAPLIDRVLGDEGHLSNEQAASLLSEAVARSRPGRLRHLVQLHLSRDCNRPALALAAARTALVGAAPQADVHVAEQDIPGPTFSLGRHSDAVVSTWTKAG
ncbi:MAG: MBL fold metallo-hydrolase [Pirellulales bacterium]